MLPNFSVQYVAKLFASFYAICSIFVRNFAIPSLKLKEKQTLLLVWGSAIFQVAKHQSVFLPVIV